MTKWLQIAVVLMPAAAVAQTPELPKGDKIYLARPTPEGYQAEVLLPAGVIGEPRVDPMDPAITKDTLSVTALKDANGKPRAAVVRVKQKTLRSKGYPMLLTVAWQAEPEPEAKAKPARPGEEKKPDKKTLEYLITVTIPAATLQQLPAKVVLTQTTYLWGFPGTCVLTDCERRIPLAPEESQAWLTNVRATPTAFLKDTGAVDGSLDLKVDPAGNDAQSSPTSVPILVITARNDFELGTSAGTVRIAADQLERPVNLPVSVENKLSRMLLLPPLIAGLLSGFALRNRLQERIAQRELQIEARKLSPQLATHADSVLEGKLDAVRKKIEAGFDAKSDALKTSVKAWQDELKAAFEDFERRKATFLADAGELHGTLNRTYRLPAEFSLAVSEAKGSLATLLTLPRNDVRGAETKRDSIERELTARLQAEARNLDAQQAARRRAVERARRLLLPEDAQASARDAESAATHEAAIATYGRSTGPPRSELRAMLDAVHHGETFWSELARRLGDRLETFIAAIDTELRDRGWSRDVQWLAWSEDARQTAELVRRENWTLAASQLARLRDRLADLIRGWAKTLPDQEKQLLLGDLDTDNFRLAIRKMKRADSLAGSIVEQRPQQDVTRPIGSRIERVEPPRHGPEPDVAERGAIPTVGELEIQLAGLQASQRLLLGVLIVLAGWGVLSAAFTGNWVQFVSAFGWAFLTDVTVEGAAAGLAPFKAKVTL